MIDPPWAIPASRDPRTNQVTVKSNAECLEQGT